VEENMARPVQRTARKDYPANNIAKGEVYWFVQIKTGPRSSSVLRQKTPFKRQQLTGSDYLRQLYEWEDRKAEISSMDDAQELADDIGTLGEEQQEKFDNMPEGLQSGDSGQMLEARANGCEAAKGEIEEAISDWESGKDTWESEIETYKAELLAYEESRTAHADWESVADSLDEEETHPDPEPVVEAEPDLPENTIDNGDGNYEFDESEWLDRVREVSVEE
jgi:hypothetical protein